MLIPRATSPLLAEIILATKSFALIPEFYAKILGKTSNALANLL
jgi:hypothetical protein